jgi:DNA-binding transcriptional LysR family regulator
MELGRRQIARLLAEFAARHPGLEVHLMLSDADLEVRQDGIDVAFRNDRPDHPAVTARKIASTRRVLCGAPFSLAARGMPERPADLGGHECLRLARRYRLHDRWRFRTENGLEEIKVGGLFPAAAATCCTVGHSKAGACLRKPYGMSPRTCKPDASLSAWLITGATRSSFSSPSSQATRYLRVFGSLWISWRLLV